MQSTFDYDDVAQTWRGLVHGGLTLKGQTAALAGAMSSWRTSESFTGTTIAAMTDHVDHGYVAEGMKLPASRPARPRGMWRYDAEEGDLQWELMEQDDDRPFLKRTPRKRQPGVRIAVRYNFKGGVPSETVNAYAEWVARMLKAMQGRGFDTEISVFSVCKMAGLGEVRTDIRVKRFGRKSSLKSWGALFAPGGFRMLVFTSRMMACRDHGKQCCPMFGGSVATPWGLDWDAKTRTLTVNCNANGYGEFPAAQMDAELGAIKF